MLVNIVAIPIAQIISAHPISAVTIAGCVGNTRKVVKALFDFAIYCLEEITRFKKEWRDMMAEPWKKKERAPKVRPVTSPTQVCGNPVEY